MNMVHVFPLNQKKAPAVPQGTDWRDYAGITSSPIYGIAVPDGVIVLDLDTYKVRKDGSTITTDEVDEALGCALDWAGAELQATLNGGKHYAFSVPPGSPMKNAQDALGIVGLDTRSTGKGYIATGKGYTALTFVELEDALSEPGFFPELPFDALTKLRDDYQAENNADPGVFDLDIAYAAQPLNISRSEMQTYLDMLTEDHASENWLTVIQAVHHQSEGAEWGWEMADAFSRKCPEKYNEKNNRKRWASFGKSPRANPVTFASIKKLVGRIDDKTKVESLVEKAGAVSSLDEYDQFKKEMRGIPDAALPSDLRSMVVGALASNDYVKGKGVGKIDVRKALAYKKEAAPGEGQRPSWSKDWVYVENICEFANVINPEISIRREAFNAKYDRLCQGLEPSTAAAFLIQNGHIETVYDAMWMPGMDRFFEYNGKEMLNSYSPTGYFAETGYKVDAKGREAIERFKTHISHLTDCDRQQDILLSFLAFPMQNIGQRINWLLLLQGGQGIGKSYISNFLQAAFNNSAVGIVDVNSIEGRFTSWAAGNIFNVIEEMRINGINKMEVSDKMKQYITNDVVSVERKGVDAQKVPNTTSYLAFTNHKNALFLDKGDRRYCVIYSDLQSEADLRGRVGDSDAYFTALFDDLEAGRAYDIAHWLTHEYQIPVWFKPKGSAPVTVGKENMISLSQSEDSMRLEDQIEKHECPIINDTIFCVTHYNHLLDATDLEIPARTMSAILPDMGYSPIKGRRMRAGKGRDLYYVWIRNVDEATARDTVKAYLGDAYEDADFQDVPF